MLWKRLNTMLAWQEIIADWEKLDRTNGTMVNVIKTIFIVYTKPDWKCIIIEGLTEKNT